MEEDTEVDEGEGDADDSEDGDLPEVGTASDNEDHVSEEFDESEDVSASDEEQVNEPSTTRNTRGRGRVRAGTALLRRPIMDAIQLIELDSGEFEAGTEIPAKVKRTQGHCHLCPREFDRKT